MDSAAMYCLEELTFYNSCCLQRVQKRNRSDPAKDTLGLGLQLVSCFSFNVFNFYFKIKTACCLFLHRRMVEVMLLSCPFALSSELLNCFVKYKRCN